MTSTRSGMLRSVDIADNCAPDERLRLGLGVTKKPVVAVMTSAHSPFDIRIFLKQCRSLAGAGYDVVLIVPHERPEVRDGVRIHSLSWPKSRVQRMIRTTLQVYRAVRSEDAAVCHFHDPELIPVGLLLKLRGHRVVYDVHEDLSFDILDLKPYIPKLARRPLSVIADLLERGASKCFDRIVAATPAIAARFAPHRTTLVQNFPIVTTPLPALSEYASRPPWVLYAGIISVQRGIHEMIEAVGLLPESTGVRLKLAGKFSPQSLEQELQRLPGWKRVDFVGWQTRDQLDSLMDQCRLGLVTLPPAKSYEASQPNKLFEYMAMGLPTVASNFPLWRQIVEGTGSGMLVDPLNVREIASAIHWLLEHPCEAEAMGQNGRSAVRSKYNWDSEAAALLKMYRTLV